MKKPKDSQARQSKILPPRGRANILDRLTNILPRLHTAEEQAALAILSEPGWVAENSIKAFAERANVSEPTIMRLSRKLDLRGFSALKRRLTEDLIIAKMYLEAEQVSQSSSPSTVVEALLRSAVKSMEESAMKLDVEVLERATNLLADADMVYCFGVGGSSALLAEEAVNRLFRLRVNAEATADPYRQRMVASIAKPSDLFLFVSATGRPSSLVESAVLARSNGASVISITAPGSPLAAHSNELVGIEIIDDEVYFNLPSRTRYSQLFVIDCLSATLAARLPDSAENLKSIRTTLGALHGVTKFQPIGD